MLKQQKPKNNRSRQLQSRQSFRRTCDCDINGGPPHPINSAKAWERHQAYKAGQMKQSNPMPATLDLTITGAPHEYSDEISSEADSEEGHLSRAERRYRGLRKRLNKRLKVEADSHPNSTHEGELKLSDASSPNQTPHNSPQLEGSRDLEEGLTDLEMSPILEDHEDLTSEQPPLISRNRRRLRRRRQPQTPKSVTPVSPESFGGHIQTPAPNINTTPVNPFGIHDIGPLFHPSLPYTNRAPLHSAANTTANGYQTAEANQTRSTSDDPYVVDDEGYLGDDGSHAIDLLLKTDQTEVPDEYKESDSDESENSEAPAETDESAHITQDPHIVDSTPGASRSSQTQTVFKETLRPETPEISERSPEILDYAREAHDNDDDSSDSSEDGELELDYRNIKGKPHILPFDMFTPLTRFG